MSALKTSTKPLKLKIEDPSHCRVLQDPALDGVYHIEAWLNFREAMKLKLGNANVRPPMQNKRPYKAMLNTVETDPRMFQLKNRGITYICLDGEFDERAGELTIKIPDVPLSEVRDTGIRFGIADGGHTFDVINQTVAKEKEYHDMAKWTMPYVRVHFIMTRDLDNIEPIVEALNTSSQVQQYTLDEYQNKFAPLKEALDESGFPTDIVAFRENEDKEWHVIEIIQRMACFMKDRWVSNQPVNMYKSKSKALKLYTSDTSQGDFRELFPVIKDIITLPEYIQSQFSRGDLVSQKSLSKLKGVKAEKKTFTRPGTDYPSDHKMDIAALLPMAAGFRELLVKSKNTYDWRCDYKGVFQLAAKDLYDHMVQHLGRVPQSSQIATDTEYWSGCVTLVHRAEREYLESKGTKSITRKKVEPLEDDEPAPRDTEEDTEYSQVVDARAEDK